jgi:hypothetical protein
VRLDRLRVEALLADAFYEHRRRHFAGTKAGDLHALRQVVRGMLDRMLEVVGGNLDGQSHAIVVELLDLSLHQTIH